MNLTYKIENYYPSESRIFCVFTPEDTTLEPYGGWINVTADMTQEQIHEAVMRDAPYYKWELQPNLAMATLLGGTATITKPADPVPPPAPVVDVQAQFTRAIQQRLNNFAKERGYDSIVSASTYVTSTIASFAAEAQRCVELRDLTWAKGYEILAAVQSGQRAMPTLEDVIAELPELTWV